MRLNVAAWCGIGMKKAGFSGGSVPLLRVFGDRKPTQQLAGDKLVPGPVGMIGPGEQVG
jgi:hypothetical protein